MIRNDAELQAALQRIAGLEALVSHLHKIQSNPHHYRAAVSGFLAQIGRVQTEVREYRRSHTPELSTSA